jgi:hypothetical protein
MYMANSARDHWEVLKNEFLSSTFGRTKKRVRTDLAVGPC